MPSKLFSSKQNFRHAFEKGLLDLMNEDGLGAYILACANATFDPVIFNDMKTMLQIRYQQFAAIFSHHPQMMLEYGSEDDAEVFKQLSAHGFDALELTRHRSEGDWELQFNQLRSYRPKRHADREISALHFDFDEEGFHFNKPFLRKETFWAGELLGHKVDLLYNKFPFVDMHGLLVPDRDKQVPQYLTKNYHDYVWQVVQTLGEKIEGVGLGYNAYGAHCSVNHLHFQMFVRDEPLPVTRGHWLHNGGSDDYPTACMAFDSADASWAFINTLHQRGVTYNLIYMPGRLYCLPRRFQGSYRHSEWTSGFSWYEMGGGMMTARQEHYDGLVAADIEREFGLLEVDLAGL